MHAFADKNADYFVADPEVVGKALSEAPTDLDHYTPESLVAFTAAKKALEGAGADTTRAEAKTLIRSSQSSSRCFGVYGKLCERSCCKRSGRKTSP